MNQVKSRLPSSWVALIAQDWPGITWVSIVPLVSPETVDDTGSALCWTRLKVPCWLAISSGGSLLSLSPAMNSRWTERPGVGADRDDGSFRATAPERVGKCALRSRVYAALFMKQGRKRPRCTERLDSPNGSEDTRPAMLDTSRRRSANRQGWSPSCRRGIPLHSFRPVLPSPCAASHTQAPLHVVCSSLLKTKLSVDAPAVTVLPIANATLGRALAAAGATRSIRSSSHQQHDKHRSERLNTAMRSGRVGQHVGLLVGA